MKTVLTKALDCTADKLTAARTAAKDAVRDLQGAVRALREQVEATRAERVQVATAKPPMAVLEAGLDQDLARLRRQWLELHGGNLLAVLAPVVDPDAGPPYRPTRHASLEQLPVFDLGTMAALFPAELRAGILAALPPFEEGLPMGERAARLVALDAHIADLETQHAQLVDEAASAGIVLDHLPETLARRHREARDQERIDTFNHLNAAAIRAGRVKEARTIEEAR